MQSFFEKTFGNIDHHLEVLFNKSDDDKGIQNKYTPLNKIESVTGFKFSSVLNQNIKKVGILFNAEFVRYFLKSFDENYLNNIDITYFYDSEYDRNDVDHIRTEYGYKKDIELISIENFNEQNKDLKIIMNNKHFDIIFSNPPYNNNLDLKILQQIFQFAKNIIFIHPAGFLFDKSFNTKLYNDIRNTNYLEQVNFFFGNKIFDIELFLPMCISIWNMNKTSDTCTVIDNALWNISYTSKINDISFHNINMNNILNDFKNQFKNTISMMSKRVNVPQTDFNIFISPIKGTKPQAAKRNEFSNLSYDLFTIVTKDMSKSIVDKNFRFKKTFSEPAKFLWSFNTQDERDNCLHYLKTKFTRFLLSYTKINQHMENNFNLIPWLDFTKSWNDKDLCQEFNISKELWEYINKFIPDYYNDYKSGF